MIHEQMSPRRDAYGGDLVEFHLRVQPILQRRPPGHTRRMTVFVSDLRMYR
jgi:hypothetical protein